MPLDLATQVALTSSTVLLVGETGTGKERFAEFIHRASPRRDRHMVRVNCSAIPSALIESELFGRERGAYTGALSKQIGRFELAQGSTLFLDEIGDLPMDVQVKLLRVLQERTIERLGSPTPIAVDVRIIAATHRDLEAPVRAGTFRADLYYRLNVFPIVVPPLRERREDIPQLVRGPDRRARRQHSQAVRFRRAGQPERAPALRLAGQRARAAQRARARDDSRHRTHLEGRGAAPGSSAPDACDRNRAPPGQTLKELEREHIVRVLTQVGWRVRGSGGAAELLGLKPTSLEARMARLGIRRPSRQPLVSDSVVEKLHPSGGRQARRHARRRIGLTRASVSWLSVAETAGRRGGIACASSDEAEGFEHGRAWCNSRSSSRRLRVARHNCCRRCTR